MLHVPLGLKVPVLWRGALPYVYEQHYKDLKLAHKIHCFKQERLRPELLSRAAT